VVPPRKRRRFAGWGPVRDIATIVGAALLGVRGPCGDLLAVASAAVNPRGLAPNAARPLEKDPKSDEMGRRVDRPRSRLAPRRARPRASRAWPAALDSGHPVQTAGQRDIVMRQAAGRLFDGRADLRGHRLAPDVGPVPSGSSARRRPRRLIISSASPAAAPSFSASASTRRWTARARPYRPRPVVRSSSGR